MLPQGNLNNLFYPMTADIYYATSSQNGFGEMEKSWTFDRNAYRINIRKVP